MSKLYGQVRGDEKVARTTTAHHWVRATAQSYDGSVSIEMDYTSVGALRIGVRVCEGSGVGGDLIFSGTFDEFKAKLLLKS